MSDEKDGGPAFPAGVYGSEMRRGMSLRDWFAGMALQGLCASRVNGVAGYLEITGRQAYKFADAMLAERAK